MNRGWVRCAATLLALLPLSASARGARLKYFSANRWVPGHYIVILDESVDTVRRAPGDVVKRLASKYGANVKHYYEDAVIGFAATLTPAAALLLSQEPHVAWVEEDSEVYGATVQVNPTWNLDRTDQTNLPLSGTYTYNLTAAGVHVYVLDSGIRSSHVDFGGRADGVFDAVNDGFGTTDCNGHGTHVAGIIGGATYGMAKGVQLHAVRVLGCNNRGLWSQIIAGVDWVTAHHLSPAVVNMSIGGAVSASIDTAVQNSINAGVTYVVAAGNDSADACSSSPADVTSALTVGASNSQDAVANFSNQGACVDLFAPGTSVLSTYNTSDTALAVMDGTSMAAPHVTGFAALFLAGHPSATPAQTSSQITSWASSGVLQASGLAASSPNLLLNSTNQICDPSMLICAGTCCRGTPNGYPTCSGGSCGIGCNAPYVACGGRCLTNNGCPRGYYWDWDICRCSQ